MVLAIGSFPHPFLREGLFLWSNILRMHLSPLLFHLDQTGEDGMTLS
jgi:hypothetical protein